MKKTETKRNREIEQKAQGTLSLYIYIYFSSFNSSLVLGLSAVVGCSSLLSHVKDRFQLAPVSWQSCRQQASLFMQGHGRAAFSILLQMLLYFEILGHRGRIFEGIKDPPF